ncbi:4024_t:CDS:2 [Scutellospora calospora]|uniref:4024_t:CDS:1 n=1 Tax=Scutellospora calospora TaxID=85575 RepID=A0ACA9JUI6_9GLOM|nr:4024_t:CDS:2 [Scutellospora calospora]
MCANDVNAKAIQQLWDKGIRSANKIRKRTNLPRSTIYFNISKLKKNGSVAHQKRSGHPTKISSRITKALIKQVKKEPSISTRSLAAKKYLNHDWRRTLFSDETAFQLFRNTVEYWFKDKCSVRRVPKDKTKIKVWGGFYCNGKTSLFCFRGIMNGLFYVNILENHFPEEKIPQGVLENLVGSMGKHCELIIEKNKDLIMKLLPREVVQ